MITFNMPDWLILLLTALWFCGVALEVWAIFLKLKIRKIEREIEELTEHE